jgi:uncharacterized protein
MADAQAPLCARAAELVATLCMRPHPEGGYYAEVFRSTQQVQPKDDRPPRQALTSIDFLLGRGQFSAWHRVASDEAWHLLEGGPLRLWFAPPSLSAFSHVDLQTVAVNHASPQAPTHAPRHVVPAGWWQAAEPLGDFAYVGATVGPGFEFADFDFGRKSAAFSAALQRLTPELSRLL